MADEQVDLLSAPSSPGQPTDYSSSSAPPSPPPPPPVQQLQEEQPPELAKLATTAALKREYSSNNDDDMRTFSDAAELRDKMRDETSSLPPTPVSKNSNRRESYLSTFSVTSPGMFGRVRKLFSADNGGASSGQLFPTSPRNTAPPTTTSSSAVAAAKATIESGKRVTFEKPPLQSQPSLRKTLGRSMSFRRVRATFKTEEGAAPPMPKPAPISTVTKQQTPSQNEALSRVKFENGGTTARTPSLASFPAQVLSRQSVSDGRKSTSSMLFGRADRADTATNSTRFAISKRKSGKLQQEQLSAHELAFLPGDLLKRLGESAGQLPPAPSVFTGMGAILFVDVSGFTALAEKLGKENVPVKASEKLANTITRVLQVLAKVCLDGGGEVGKFCGDALLCVWEADNAKDLDHAEYMAKTCAIEMLVQMENLNRLERVDLQIHGGLAKGSVVHFHFGSTDDELRWYLMSGEAVSAATTLVDVALAGEFCCLEGNAKGLPVGFATDAAAVRPDGEANSSSNVFSLTRGEQQTKAAATSNNGSSAVKTVLLTSKSKLPALPKHMQKQMQLQGNNTGVASVLKDGLPKACNVYIPSSLREQLNYRSACKGEMRRRIAILFCEISSLTMTTQELARETVSDAKLDSLNSAYVTMTRILHAFNGEVRDMLFDDKGCVYIGMFGAHEEEEDEAHSWTLNAVQAALAIIHEIPGARAGVSTGTCFVGMAGVIERRTDFVVVGHEVNMAARYMSNAKPGQILVSSAVMANTKEHVQYGAEQLIMVGKGKWAKQRAVYSPLSENARRESFQQLYRTLIGSASSQFVGRGAEISAIEKTMQKINNGGRSGVIVMEAPCGRGKSALVKRIKKMGRGKVKVVSGEGVLSERNTPYFPLRAVLESYTGIRPSMNPREIKQVIEKLERSGRGDKINIKALALILPWIQGLTGTGGKADVQPGEMADTLLKIIKLSFEHSNHHDQSALVVLDDAQWFDAASLEILLLLVDGMEKTQKICLLLTFRTQAECEFEEPFLLLEDTAEENRKRQDLVQKLKAKCKKLKLNSLWFELQKLGKTENTLLAEKLLGAQPTVQFADALFDACQGDPSFLMYTIRYLLELPNAVVIREGDGQAALSASVVGTALPKTCDEAILKRVNELLTPEQRRVLEWAASAGGGTFDAQYVDEVSKQQVPANFAFDTLQLCADLDLCTNSVVNLPNASPGTQKWDFNHDLIFRAIWQSFTETRRKEMLLALREERKRLDDRVKQTANAFAATQQNASSASSVSPSIS